MSRASFSHRPVLLHEVTAVFEKMKIRCFVDGTLGSGGHAYEILKHHTHAQLIGLDMDKIMIAEAKKRLKPFQSRCRIFHRNFACLKDVMDAQHSPALDGLLLDLGISSRHLDTPERGFSFQHEGPLDMRLDRTVGQTACRIINEETREKIAEIIFLYGEDRDAKRIANAIVRFRETKPFETTKDLESIIRRVKGKKSFQRNPAARVFQAFRIYVNKEQKSRVE